MIKVFLGPTDTGHNYYLKKGLKAFGYRLTTCLFKDKSQFGWKNDIDLKLKKRYSIESACQVFLNFLRSLKYDLYHFSAGMSLLPLNLDLPLLKLMGKKMIMHYEGSCLRQLDFFRVDPFNRLLGKEIGYKKFNEMVRRWKYHWVKSWVDKITVATPDLLAFAPEAEFVPNLSPQMGVELTSQKGVTGEIFIAHAPTKRRTKGSGYVIKAVERLQRENYPVKLYLIENQTHLKTMAIYAKSDIIVDQLLIGAYGKVSIEGMMLGKPVVCYIRPDLKEYYPSDLPVISANPRTCYQVLKRLLSDQGLRERVGKQSLAYVKDFHNYRKIIKRWANIYEETLNKK